MRKTLWSPAEDEMLKRCVERYGTRNWKEIANRTGLGRCPKSCRLRWFNYLRPDLKRCPFSPLEAALLLHLHACYGNRWSKIASHLPGRSDNDVKNFWHTFSRRSWRAQYASTITTTAISTQYDTLNINAPTNNNFITNNIGYSTTHQEANTTYHGTSNSVISTPTYHHHHNHNHNHRNDFIMSKTMISSSSSSSSSLSSSSNNNQVGSLYSANDHEEDMKLMMMLKPPLMDGLIRVNNKYQLGEEEEVEEEDDYDYDEEERQGEDDYDDEEEEDDDDEEEEEEEEEDDDDGEDEDRYNGLHRLEGADEVIYKCNYAHDGVIMNDMVVSSCRSPIVVQIANGNAASSNPPWPESHNHNHSNNNNGNNNNGNNNNGNNNSNNNCSNNSAGINGNHQIMASSRKSESNYKPPEGLDLIGWKLQNPSLPIPSTWREH